MAEFNIFIVNVKMTLERYEKRTPQDAIDEIMASPRDLYMYLFYNADKKFAGVVMEIMNDINYHIDEGKPIFSTTVKYFFRKPISKVDLRKGVEDIFAHFQWAGHISYNLRKFEIISRIKNSTLEQISNKAFVNLL